MYGLRTYAVLLGSWLALCIPFEVIDRTGVFERYRLQPEAFPPSEALKRRALSMAFGNWLWLSAAVCVAAPLLEFLFPVDAPTSTAKLMLGLDSIHPALWVVLQIGISFLLDDFSFYTYHRILHTGRFYAYIHKQHHEFKAPFAWSSHAVHPVEMLLQSVGAMMGPILLGMDLETYWIWLCVRQWQGVLDHIGYELPFDLCTWIPGVGGTSFHDAHHKHFTANYASCFSFIDDLFGTRYVPRKKCTVKAL